MAMKGDPSLADVVDRDDVRVVQGGRGPRLLLEPRARPASAANSGEDLERHVAVKVQVPRTVDLTHAAGAELSGDFVRPDFRSGSDGRHVEEEPIIALAGTGVTGYGSSERWKEGAEGRAQRAGMGAERSHFCLRPALCPLRS